jgi:ABC-2 type transport system permease protein
MTGLDSRALTRARRTGTTPLGLVAAEIMKIRTTNTWWLFLVGVVVFTSQALLRNGASHHFDLNPPLDRMNRVEQAQAVALAAEAHTDQGAAAIAADMMTSGQFFGVLFALLIGVLVLTNEFHHQTATATFMINPRRTVVVLAKFVAAACFGALFWLISTAVDVVVTPIYLNSQHLNVSVTDWVVVRSVLLNLLAFTMWSVFGLGLGALVRSQIGAVVTGVAVYLVGAAAVAIIFELIYNIYPHNWVHAAPVIAPAVASLVMTTAGQPFPDAPPQWVGLLVMIGYALTFGTIGVALIRRRDVT